MANENVDLLDPEESDNSLGWFKGLVMEDYFSTPMIETGGQAAAYDNANQWQRYWQVKILDIFQDWEREVPDTMNLAFGLGKDWNPTDDSNTILRHKSDTGQGRPKTFDMKSKMGKLMAQMQGKQDSWTAPFGVVVLDGGPDPKECGGIHGYNMKPALAYLREAEFVDPRQAGIFNNTVWLFRSLGLKYDKERDVRGRPHPVHFLGTDPNVAVESATPRAAAQVEIDREKLAEITGVPDSETLDALTKLLQTSTTHRSFARNALTAYPDLKDQIMDETNGVWSARTG